MMRRLSQWVGELNIAVERTEGTVVPGKVGLEDRGVLGDDVLKGMPVAGLQMLHVNVGEDIL